MTRCREALRRGAAPDAIRTYEFLNFYSIGYPSPPQGELGIFADLKPAADEGTYDLQLGVRSWDREGPRRPVTMTFVMDTSGSMGGEPMERQVAAIKAIASELRQGDIVNAVTWSTTNAIVLAKHEVSGPNDPTVIGMADALSAGGGTDLNGGLVAGYDLAQQTYGEDRINRVVLISDGGANAGETDAEIIGENAEDNDKEGIYLVGIGVGPAQRYHDALMDTVTDAGRGAYVYVDSPLSAQTLLGARFDEVFDVAARSVQVELTLPWYFEMFEFYGEEYSENPEEVDPQHLAPGDAMVFSQVLRACDAQMINPSDEISVTVNWQTPISYADNTSTFNATVGELLELPSPALTKGRAVVAFAEALKTGNQFDLQEAHTQILEANPSGIDLELTEMADLVSQHPAF